MACSDRMYTDGSQVQLVAAFLNILQNSHVVGDLQLKIKRYYCLGTMWIQTLAFYLDVRGRFVRLIGLEKKNGLVSNPGFIFVRRSLWRRKSSFCK